MKRSLIKCPNWEAWWSIVMMRGWALTSSRSGAVTVFFSFNKLFYPVQRLPTAWTFHFTSISPWTLYCLLIYGTAQAFQVILYYVLYECEQCLVCKPEGLVTQKGCCSSRSQVERKSRNAKKSTVPGALA